MPARMPEKREIRHPLAWRQFYAECFRYASTGAWGVVGDLATGLPLAALVLKHAAPRWYGVVATFLASRAISDDWMLLVPAIGGWLILLGRVVTAPFILYRDKPNSSVETASEASRRSDNMRNRPDVAISGSMVFGAINMGGEAAYSVTTTIGLPNAMRMELERIPLIPTAPTGSAGEAAQFTGYGWGESPQQLHSEKALGHFLLRALVGQISEWTTQNKRTKEIDFDVRYTGPDGLLQYTTPHRLTFKWDGSVNVTIERLACPQPQPVHVS